MCYLCYLSSDTSELPHLTPQAGTPEEGCGFPVSRQSPIQLVNVFPVEHTLIEPNVLPLHYAATSVKCSRYV